MFCNACGTENNNSAAYCSACGAKLANNHAPVKSAKASQSTFEKEKAKHDAQTELAQMIYGIKSNHKPAITTKSAPLVNEWSGSKQLPPKTMKYPQKEN